MMCSLNAQQMPTNITTRRDITIGPCTWILERQCPDDDVKFWLFTRSNPDDRQLIQINDSWENSNLSTSFYNPQHPVKIIIHGIYNIKIFDICNNIMFCKLNIRL